MAASGFGFCALVPVCSSENCSPRAPIRSAFFPLLSSAGRSFSYEVASCSAKFIGLVSVASPRSVKRNAILALDPDFYKIPYVEGIPVGSRLKLFNLAPDDDREMLKEELTEWFESIDITVVSLEFTDDPELNAQGVGGFVEMGTKMEACMAVARLDGSKFKGRYVRMDFVERRPHEREIGGRRNRPSYSSYSSSDSRPSYASSPSNANKMFVGNLAWSVDDAGLQRLFSSHGTVYEARVMRDRDSGRSRGFGFVVMSTADEMQAAISALDGQTMEGRSLKVNVATARA